MKFIESKLYHGLQKEKCLQSPPPAKTKGLFGLRGERGRVERSRIELTENRLILCQIYSTLLYSPSFPLNSNRRFQQTFSFLAKC